MTTAGKRFAEIGWLTATLVASWLILALPVWLWQGRWGLIGLTAAALLCLAPGVGLLAALRTLPQPTELSAIAALISGGFRMLFVAVGLVIAQRSFPQLDFWRFCLWLGVFYVIALATETTLLVRHDPPRQVV